MKRPSGIFLLVPCLALLAAPVAALAGEGTTMAPAESGVVHEGMPATDAQHDQHPVETAHEDGGHGGEAHGNGGLPQFDPSSFPSQVFWLALTLAFLYVFFSRKTIPDLTAIVEGRESHIRTHLDLARQKKEKAEGMRLDYEREIQKARQEARDVFSTAETEVKRRSDEGYRAFQKRLDGEVQKVAGSIERAKADAMDDMHALAAEIAAQAAEKIIGVGTDIDHAKTVVQSLKAKAA